MKNGYEQNVLPLIRLKRVGNGAIIKKAEEKRYEEPNQSTIRGNKPGNADSGD
jgi:hypothetical protein